MQIKTKIIEELNVCRLHKVMYPYLFLIFPINFLNFVAASQFQFKIIKLFWVNKVQMNNIKSQIFQNNSHSNYLMIRNLKAAKNDLTKLFGSVMKINRRTFEFYTTLLEGKLIGRLHFLTLGILSIYGNFNRYPRYFLRILRSFQ